MVPRKLEIGVDKVRIKRIEKSENNLYRYLTNVLDSDNHVLLLLFFRCFFRLKTNVLTLN